MRVVQQEMGASTRSMQQAFDTVIHNGRKRGQGFDDLKNLASITSSVGFEDVTTDVVSSDRVSETRVGFNKTTLGALSGMIEMFKRDTGVRTIRLGCSRMRAKMLRAGRLITAQS
jgi:hypothetical protein